ncbi:hypothetical protein AN2335V1_4790 (plasmid) [Klebsiella variicola]|uniref:Uncharacterized protein n=1 Tax=Klebsiella variicola TaxID=244366 RepID=A0A9P0VE70_KLEVA|nr:hypothetical protein AN2335V1_4790 [Klebsiella variicola]
MLLSNSRFLLIFIDMLEKSSIIFMKYQPF